MHVQQGFLQAIGRSGKPAKGRGSQVEKMAPFLGLDNLKTFVDLELADSTSEARMSVITDASVFAALFRATSACMLRLGPFTNNGVNALKHGKSAP